MGFLLVKTVIFTTLIRVTYLFQIEACPRNTERDIETSQVAELRWSTLLAAVLIDVPFALAGKLRVVITSFEVLRMFLKR